MNALLMKIQIVIDLFPVKNQRPDVNEILNFLYCHETKSSHWYTSYFP